MQIRDWLLQKSLPIILCNSIILALPTEPHFHFHTTKKWTLFCRVSKGLKGITKAPKFNMFTLQNTDFSLSLIVVEGLSVAEGSFTALMKINRQCLIINHFEDLYLDMGTEEGSENEWISSDDVCISSLTDNLSL